MKTENIFCNDDDIKVSVCCATYNHEKYIEKALEGFVSQVTNFKFEIIVHEDVSTDNTRQIVQRYAEQYPDLIVPIFQQVNQYSQRKGLVQRNMFAKARGKYIALCEGDDYWIDEYKLQKQYDAMEKNPECSVCVHKVKHKFEGQEHTQENGSGINLKTKYGIDEGKIEKRKMAEAIWILGGYPFHTSSYFVRKSILTDWIDEKADYILYMNGDMSMSRTALMHGEFLYLEGRMSCRRHGVEGSWSESWSASTIKAKLKHYQEMINGERLFDAYSNFQFHKYIWIHIFNLIAECCIYETENISTLLKKNPIHVRDIYDKRSFYVFLRYLLMKISPDLYRTIYKCIEKRS